MANAFREVSGSLVDRTKLVETERQRARAVRAYQEAVRLANRRYTSGLSAYFEVLDAQQALYPAEISLARTHLDQPWRWRTLQGPGRRLACTLAAPPGRQRLLLIEPSPPLAERPPCSRRGDPPRL